VKLGFTVLLVPDHLDPVLLIAKLVNTVLLDHQFQLLVLLAITRVKPINHHA
jgi:hypothetical protein